MGRSKPEGPYETDDQTLSRGVSSTEISRLLDFVDQFQGEAERALSVKTGYNELRILTMLMRYHLGGKLCTSSSVASASGLSYGTAMRALASIEERGLLVKRPKTATGKSFSLHPTPKLILEWQEFARRSRALFGDLVDADREAQTSGYYFGASYSDNQTLAPLSAFDARLPLKGELRLLVHADPTFMAMHSLKKHFETVFGVGIWSRALSIDRLRAEILENSKANQSRYDLVACDLPWFGEMAEFGRFLPLDDMIRDSRLDLSDFHSVALASTRYRKRQYGIPVQTTPELLVCRRDLFRKQGVKSPRTIEETVAAARELHDPFNGVSGIAWNAARGTPLGHSFMFVCAALGQPILNLRRFGDVFDCETVEGECYRPMFDSPEAEAAAEYFAELLDFSPPGILNMSWYERARCFADGKAAIAYSATLLAPLFELDKKSPAHGNVEYLPGPFGMSGRPIAPVGGYAIAIPANIEPKRDPGCLERLGHADFLSGDQALY